MRTLILLVILMLYMLPTVNNTVGSNPYILVGGQNGTWFRSGQNPKLYKLFLSNYATVQLTPVPSEGTVWTGGWNGSQWLISGWGTDPGSGGSNPYLYLYDGAAQVTAGSLNQYESEASWHGGDIFAATYNGRYWLLSGMGSDSLPGFYTGQPVNHMSLAIFDGHDFTDLSTQVPDQQANAILYTNTWNGTDWLVGGGYADFGVLFAFNGTRFINLTNRITKVVDGFASVQAIAWNGRYWLIGGVGFLAEYDGDTFIDLTPRLRTALRAELVHAESEVEGLSTGRRASSFQLTVNAIAWNGSSWMLGGGSPVAQLTRNVAWLASYAANRFVDLSFSLPDYVSQLRQSGSSVLSISPADSSWVVGGYSDNHAVLLQFGKGSLVDLSRLVSDMSYVIWVSKETYSLPSVDPPICNRLLCVCAVPMVRAPEFELSG